MNRGSLCAWLGAATAFGYVEAAVVAYLRLLIGLPRGAGYMDLGSDGVRRALASHGLLTAEVIREAMTLVLLAAGAGAVGRTTRQRIALFGAAFALWDLAYYAFLAALAGFPRSLLDTDIYFLIPTAWYGPVWFPVEVVMPAILAASLWALRPGAKEDV